MDEGQGSAGNLERGRRQLMQLAIGSLVICVLLLVEEIVNWNAIGFVIAQAVLSVGLGILWMRVLKGANLRWLMFIALMACGVFGFLLGGLHLQDPLTEKVDPLCYWLVAGGLSLLGMGGFFIYSLDIDAYLRSIRKPQA